MLEKAERWPMAKLVEEERTFRNFPYARYATDVTFQQANRPSGNIAEGKNTTVESTSFMVIKSKYLYCQRE